ncbi:hypothetical protein SAMN05444166_7846 [Singulisphaera sp. GP187]|uniref:hypothetical protein n=1 Tax=Singulisphaera sp. GP187 TaxID=1882752 RepID=UPI00092733EE|nr:hypothetical protein [Singulisphaera sp. GP187]SIO65815.1 hypothetical protein SAMN05444166_7846 [Singulisphaera sp. GP187]
MQWRKSTAKPTPSEPPRRASVTLGPLVDHLTAEVARWEGALVDLDLLRARLADRCRDGAIQPAPPAVVAEMFGGLDTEGLRRLALIVSALDLDEIRASAPWLLVHGSIVDRIRGCFVELARGSDLLTMELLRQSRLRVEEFARMLLIALGLGVAGESAEESQVRLVRLDYRRLLAEAERAKEAAEPRLAALRKLQEERGRQAGRGKV